MSNVKYSELGFNGGYVMLSFPLVGNLSVNEERFWISQNDRTKYLK